MSVCRLLILPGDGIGPEVTAEALRVLDRVGDAAGVRFEREEALFGGASIDACGVPATDATLKLASDADAVILGAVGGPKWDDVPGDRRPERGLLNLRAELQVFANLRPARFWPALADASPLRPERIQGVDILVVRELCGGIYFGQPSAVSTVDGLRRGVSTLVYDESEILRVGRVAFEAARKRSKRLLSVDKANVLDVMRLWREVIVELSADYPDVELEHGYVDAVAMHLVTRPADFDVIVTGNMFGDILSDETAALNGSLGMLPSASLGEGTGLYEPIHGSAPDIAGRGIANPLAAILSVGLLVEHTLDRPDLAAVLTGAVEDTLAQGLRTADLGGGDRAVGTRAMGDAVMTHLVRRLDA